jgi:hypothetical protein
MKEFSFPIIFILDFLQFHSPFSSFCKHSIRTDFQRMKKFSTKKAMILYMSYRLRKIDNNFKSKMCTFLVFVN